MTVSDRPSLLFADRNGQIYDFPYLEMVGSHAGRWRRLRPGDWIPLPEGSELFVLPDRYPAGFDPERGRFVVLDRNPYNARESIRAVAAFVAPAHTATYLAAYKRSRDARILPLFSYAAVGWYKDSFVTTAIRVDPDERQDARHFKKDVIAREAQALIESYRSNRLIQHLGRCALSYACPAARNFFMGRWEAPLPTSPVCNARCLGCISYQENPEIPVTQERLNFVPTAEEVAEVALLHIKRAERPVVSFGQGCEGEPLLQAQVLEKAIGLIRKETEKGTINLNTNASLPARVDRLFAVGLDSIRVSLNSVQERYYNAYYRPRGYSFEDVKKTILTALSHNGFVSLNYFILPGVTDDPAEVDAFMEFLKSHPVNLIQMRNFNIDPEWYINEIDFRPTGPPVGIKRWMEVVRENFPDVRFGYFNPFLR
ncbi:radical SAM protein [Thermodesulforhabdus norvegica]|uniref:Radical SAM superfamily protein n=1 Tax=Thermodesulforhabdus norvegica TaxID=39841 RepID=A0A1I4UWZ4_9BACT|nr:radical SAM protein [Thermodesulforhabdus norvegica]SFM93395.1 Radical SAM superfamily protein [Thermodesulforhabdus norvegica]